MLIVGFSLLRSIKSLWGVLKGPKALLKLVTPLLKVRNLSEAISYYLFRGSQHVEFNFAINGINL